MKKRMVAAVIFSMGVLSCLTMAGCQGKADNQAGAADLQSLELSVENATGGNGKTEAGRETENSDEMATGTVAAKDSGTQESSEGEFYDGANLSGRVMDFSDTEFKITPETLIINEDGSMTGGIAAPGYEKEEDYHTVTYTENTVFEIVYFSASTETETSREVTDKNSIKNDINVNIFGTCQGDKHWTADKVVIIRWG